MGQPKRRSNVLALYEAKTHLSEIVERASNGEEFVVEKSGKPKARILPLTSRGTKVRFGVWRGKVKIHDDFDDPLPEELLQAFEGK